MEKKPLLSTNDEETLSNDDDLQHDNASKLTPEFPSLLYGNEPDHLEDSEGIFCVKKVIINFSL